MNYKNLSNLQPKLIEDFVHILQGSHLAHAYLFSGDFGNFEMALFLAKAIFCTEKTDSLPCEMCRTCRLIESQEFSDVTILSPQGNTIKTDAVREIVKNFSQSGFESSKQVFIIKDAEKMHVNAANSLLKVIEEPQSEIYIFLLTNQLEAVLPTIKSRTQIVQFSKNLALLERSLEESGLLKTQASLLAQLVSSQDEAQKLAKNKSFLEALVQARKFIDLLQEQPNLAYLQAGTLVGLVPEKVEQGQLLDLLTILLAENLDKVDARDRLDSLLTVKKMWQSNVSLQNCLEYLTLS
ncbi:DNA polymerase III subunit delta' [Streptococcus suis]|nr:DNA polymerase III subunit delta' [Streptococcus suis]